MNTKFLPSIFCVLLFCCGNILTAQRPTNFSRAHFKWRMGVSLPEFLIHRKADQIFEIKKNQMKKLKEIHRSFTEQINKLEEPKHEIVQDTNDVEKMNVLSDAEIEYAQLCGKLQKKQYAAMLDVLNDDQKTRLRQILIQAYYASHWPFYYLKSKEFTEAMDLDLSTQKAFIDYLRNTARVNFDRQLNDAVKQHRGRVLSVLSDETRSNLLKLVGNQAPVHLIPMVRKDYFFRCSINIDKLLFEKEMGKKYYRNWSWLLVNKLVVSEIEWLDEQHENHIEILKDCYRAYRSIPKPKGEEFQVGPKTYRTILDKLDVDTYKAKLKENYAQHHKRKMKILLPHQKKRVHELIRQCLKSDKSVLAYLGDERLLAEAKASREEKHKLRQALKEETRKLNLAIQTMVAKQTRENFKQLPDAQRKLAEKLCGKPLKFFVTNKLLYEDCYLGKEKRQEVWDAMIAK